MKLWQVAVGAAVAYLVLGRKKGPEVLTDEERKSLIEDLAAQYEIDPALALAIVEVESSGAGFDDGRLVIRYEPHVFKKRTGVTVEAKRGGATRKVRQDKEYDNLARAMAVNREEALRSISMGASQIMGFNAEVIGYDTVEDQWADFNAREAAHYEGLFAFIAANPKLLEAARTADYENIARYYNGSGGVGIYDPKIKKSHDYWKTQYA